MKHILIVFVLLYNYYGIQAQSCCNSQICNLNTGADAVEDGRYFSKIGINYTFMADDFALISKISDAGSLRYNNSYHTFALSGRLGITKSLFIHFSLPCKINKVNTNNQITYFNGLGDSKAGISGIVSRKQNAKTAQQFELGTDVQIPTGKYYPADNATWNTVIVSPGTGAFSISGNAIYRLRLHQLNFANGLSYTRSFANRKQFQIGDHITDEIRFARIFTAKKIMIIPGCNTGFDYFFKNKIAGKPASLSGGKLLKAGLSVEIRWTHYTAQAGWNIPIYQELADGKYRIKQQFNFQFNYLFSIQKQIKKTK